MLVGLMVKAACGVLCIVIGLLIWLKQKVNLLHDYHYQNVTQKDMPDYCRKMGIGLIIIGVGVVASAPLTETSIWWLPLALGFVVGFILMHKAQMKYNGSWFS